MRFFGRLSFLPIKNEELFSDWRINAPSEAPSAGMSADNMSREEMFHPETMYLPMKKLENRTVVVCFSRGLTINFLHFLYNMRLLQMPLLFPKLQSKNLMKRLFNVTKSICRKAFGKNKNANKNPEAKLGTKVDGKNSCANG